MLYASPEPFNNLFLPAGGVILKSSDGIEFRVCKAILALASPFFAQMFTLPQPVEPNQSDGSEKLKESELSSIVQTIDVSETSSTLDILLRLIYPISPPEFPGISDLGEITNSEAFYTAIAPVLAAALKYDMHPIAKDLWSKLLNAAEATKPDGAIVDDTMALRIFAFACQHHSKEMARRAAHACLRGRTTGIFIEELRLINTAQYFHLIDFHQQMASKIRISLEDFQLSDDGCRCTRECTRQICHRFAAVAHPILELSPGNSQVFMTTFNGLASLERVIGHDVHFAPCLTAVKLWDKVTQMLKDKIEKVIADTEINLSEI